MNITEVSLLSTDLQQTRSFYSDILRLTVLEQGPDFVALQAGRSKLIFYLTGNKPNYHFAFNIPNNLLEAAFNYISSRTKILAQNETNLQIIDFKNWNARSFYFTDHEGNILEFIARFDLDNAGSDPDNKSYVLNVSEIGFVVLNVPQAARKLTEAGLPLFKKGPMLNDFTVLGDDNGLVLLSDSRRGWMPVSRRPEQHRIRALVENNHLQYEILLEDQLQIKLLN